MELAVIFGEVIKGKITKISIYPINKQTPPNFFGTERSIAYAGRKYHSGTMWTGVTKGFASKYCSESETLIKFIK